MQPSEFGAIDRELETQTEQARDEDGEGYESITVKTNQLEYSAHDEIKATEPVFNVYVKLQQEPSPEFVKESPAGQKSIKMRPGNNKGKLKKAIK